MLDYRFDEQFVPRVSLDDLTPGLWERFRTERSTDDREELLTKLAMARRDEDGTPRPSVAGVLLGCHEPQRWLPDAYIQAVAYRGTEPCAYSDRGLYQLDAMDITGPLDQQVFDACRFVRRNMRVMTTRRPCGKRSLLPR